MASRNILKQPVAQDGTNAAISADSAKVEPDPARAPIGDVVSHNADNRNGLIAILRNNIWRAGVSTTNHPVSTRVFRTLHEFPLHFVENASRM